MMSPFGDEFLCLNGCFYLDISMSDYTKILLEEDEMPTQWYNIVADLPEPPPPPLHPATATSHAVLPMAACGALR